MYALPKCKGYILKVLSKRKSRSGKIGLLASCHAMKILDEALVRGTNTFIFFLYHVNKGII